MLELDLTLASAEALAVCQERGLVAGSERELAGRPGSRHWHLHRPGEAGTLELSECDGRVWVKVHPRREGTWALQLARELAERRPSREQALVERSALEVMFKRCADEQASITRAWSELEEAVGSLRGRKFYGTFNAEGHEYRACVEVREGDAAEKLGLERDTLPGGRYARVRLRGEPPAVYARIAPAFQKLAQRPDVDRGRRGIEFYRRHDVIDLLQPVASAPPARRG